ncbi:MAG: nucleotidyltransferase family protein [Gemmatimonadaceae bacterium]
MIAGLLLASGASRRFGSDKLLAPLAGREVVRWSAEALAPAVDALYVVVPPDSVQLHDALHGLDVRWVSNAAASTGMASSICAGVSALPSDAEAVVIALGDQPLVDASVAVQLVARWREGGASAVAPAYDDGRGHPVLFSASLYPALLALDGDSGARALLAALGDGFASVQVAGRMPADVDTPDAFDAVATEVARRARVRG